MFFYKLQRSSGFPMSAQQRKELEAVARRTREEMDMCLLLWYRLGMPQEKKPKLIHLGNTLRAALDALALAD